MDLQIKDKRALVTASRASFGLEIARSWPRREPSVIVSGRAQDKLERAVDRTCQSGAWEIVGIVADLTVPEGIDPCSGRLMEKQLKRRAASAY